MRTLVVLYPLEGAVEDRIRAVVPDWRVVRADDSDFDPQVLREAEVVVGWTGKPAEACLVDGSSLRWIQEWSAGVDRMPLSRLRERGVLLTTASGVHAKPIAETVFGMLLSFVRGLDRFERQQVRGEWERNDGIGEIHGSTIGILGTGEIGTEVARLAKAFDMTVLGFRRSSEPAPGFDRTIGEDGLLGMLAACDAVVDTLPLTPRTRHLIGEVQFRAMKPTAFFINIGRGGTVDEAALIRALEERWIAGAGLDVFETEPLPADSPLWRLENAILTPHNAGMNPSYDERATVILLDNLRDYVAGRTPSRNLVDLTEGY
jgi:D-2-hydroxyacid dehydrogenase (NADP+)